MQLKPAKTCSMIYTLRVLHYIFTRLVNIIAHVTTKFPATRKASVLTFSALSECWGPRPDPSNFLTAKTPTASRLAAYTGSPSLFSTRSYKTTLQSPANIAIITATALRRLAILSPSLRSSPPFRPQSTPFSRAMATLGAHEGKHKVTIVGSGNW